MELPFFTTTTATSSSTAATRTEALRWLAIAEKLLAGRDLVGSKSFASRARESDPTLLYADQIIAVADTLLAGDKRINNLPDWYSVLQLTPHQSRDTELIAGQYRKLALLLNPQKNPLPFADQAFTLVISAWQVLSNPSRKHMYDNELMGHLRVNPVSSGFNPLTAGISREQVNFQPFEINFQVMPQHAMSSREEFMQPQPQPQLQPQYGAALFREPPPSQILPQQNLTRETVSQQQLPQVSGEQVRQPQVRPPPPPPQAQPQPPPQLHPQPQRKDSFVGNNVSHNFTSNIGNFSSNSANNNNNNNNNNNSNGDDDDDDNDVGAGNNRNVNVARSGAGEEEKRADGSSDGELSFWTACPYCYYMYEYPSVYAECTLKCQKCRKAFQGVVIPSPPPIADGQDAYFCCWGFMPLGVSMEILRRNRSKGGKWTPFSPMFNFPQGMGNNVGMGNWNQRVYADDEDVFLEVSDPSEESDDDWRFEKRKKKAKGVKKTGMKSKGTGSLRKRGRPRKVDKGKILEGRCSESVQDSFTVGVPNVSTTESSKKGAATNARRHSARFAKDVGKLDLNVEFNNEVEEPARKVSQGNATGRGEEDIIEGGGFFEGLDEFLSSLPILNVVGDDKVKAAS